MPSKETSIDHQLRATWQAIAKMYNDVASEHDSSMAVGFLLINIDQEFGTASTALGPQMGMKATSLSRLLKKIEEKGLIYREKNPDDGRGIFIKLTALGKEKRNLSRKNVIHFNETVKKNLTNTQQRHFFEVIEVINRLIYDKKIFKTK